MGAKTGTDEKARQDEFRRAFGSTLRQMRDQAQLTRENLAERMGIVDPNRIGDLERGEAPVELHVVVDAADALGCGVEVLLGSVMPGFRKDLAVPKRLLDIAESRLQGYADAFEQGPLLGLMADLAVLDDQTREVLAALIGSRVRDLSPASAQLHARMVGKVVPTRRRKKTP